MINEYLIRQIFLQKNLPKDVALLTSSYVRKTKVPARWRRPYLDEICQLHADYIRGLLMRKANNINIDWSFCEWVFHNGNRFFDGNGQGPFLHCPFDDWHWYCCSR